MEENNLYIIKCYGKDNTSLIKLGYSNNISVRTEMYLTHNPLCEIVDTFYRKDALTFERWFHTNNTSSFRREWYSEKYLDDIIKNIKNTPYLDDIEKDHKRCNNCNEIKTIDSFYKKRKNTLENICKKCNHKLKYIRVKNDPNQNAKRLEAKRKYRDANREKHIEYMKEYNLKRGRTL